MAAMLAGRSVGADDVAGGKKLKVASIPISGSLSEAPGGSGLFGELTIGLSEVIARLDRAAQDKEIAAVVLELREPQVGRGKLEELRTAIGRVRQAGKPVLAEMNAGTTADYLVACACDAIVMPESGELMIPGVRAEVTFYKGLFDKLGVKAEMMQVGDFKGAAEPMTRTEMSPEFRRQYETLLDDFFEQMIAAIAADRKLDAARVRELIDIGLFSPEKAKAAGLVDHVAYHDELVSLLQTRLAADKVEVVENYGKKKIDNDFSGMLGMIKLFEMLMGNEPKQRVSGSKKIAVVYAVGTIMTGESSIDFLGEQSLGSDTIVKALRKASADKTVAAIVLRVDSPGGSALASDLIWREIQQIEKPVIASMGDVAASGGYYISMGCDRIFAEPGTLTGSIGVVGGKVALKGLFDKVGVNTEVISRGKNSGILSTDTPFTDSERDAWRGMMHEIYRQFTTKAAAGRKLDLAKLETLAGGRVWTGRQAKANGLVDEIGTLRDALKAAKKAAGLVEDEKVELMTLPEPRTIFDQLFGGGPSARLTADVDAALPGAAQSLREVARLRKLFAEPAVLIMPYPTTIK